MNMWTNARGRFRKQEHEIPQCDKKYLTGTAQIHKKQAIRFDPCVTGGNEKNTMIFRSITLCMALLMLAGSLQANGWIPADCADRSCCRHTAPMAETMQAGQTESRAWMQPQNCCYCENDAGPACNLTRLIPQAKIGWALSSQRVDPSAPGLPSVLCLDNPFFPKGAAALFYSQDDTLHPASPPTYLSVMSFLC